MTKILVIEDIASLCKDIVDMLRYEGFDSLGAEDGVAGLEAAQQFHPDIIICDIMMPRMDGYEVLKAVRADQQLSGTPFIFLTAKTDRNDVREGMRRGAEDYLPKPFLATELLDTINVRLDRMHTYQRIADYKITMMRDNIASALPHELRTPLNTILGFSDLLMLDTPNLEPAQVLEWADHITQAGMRLYRLIENYLMYVRIETISRDRARASTLQQKRTVDAAMIIELQAMTRAEQATTKSIERLSKSPGNQGAALLVGLRARRE
ncbi:MAG: response regulator, partial [Armatimonadetes bacterium]|nr:response regulator [Anaerolineae bacterium]